MFDYECVVSWLRSWPKQALAVAVTPPCFVWRTNTQIHRGAACSKRFLDIMHGACVSKCENAPLEGECFPDALPGVQTSRPAQYLNNQTTKRAKCKSKRSPSHLSVDTGQCTIAIHRAIHENGLPPCFSPNINESSRARIIWPGVP